MKSSRRRVLLLTGIMLLVVCICMTACSSPGEEVGMEPQTTEEIPASTEPDAVADAGDAATSESGFTVGLACNDLDVSQAIWNEMLKEDLEPLGGELVVLNAAANVEKQISDVEDLITQGVDVIVFQPLDSEGSVPIIDACNAAGIPVIAKEAGINSTNYDAYVGIPHETQGRYDAMWVEQWLDDPPEEYLYIGGITGSSSWGLYRWNGFKEYFDETNSFDGRAEIIVEQSADWSQENAMTVMEDWLQGFPELNCIMTENDEMAAGVCNVLAAANEDFDDWIIVSINGEALGVDLVQQGKIDMTVFFSKAAITEKVAELCKYFSEGGEPLEENYILVADEGMACMTSENVDEVLSNFPRDAKAYADPSQQ